MAEHGFTGKQAAAYNKARDEGKTKAEAAMIAARVRNSPARKKKASTKKTG